MNTTSSQKKNNPLEITAASSLWNQRHLVAELKTRIRDLCKAIDWENDLELYQWVELLSFTLEFSPDLILELGRGRGNSTCVYTEAANHLSECKVISVCNSTDWENISLPRVKEVVPGNWFEPLTIINGDILTLNYEMLLGNSQRVLLFWDAHGFAIAECVLGGILPLLVDREHIVIMHDISDNRYVDQDYFDYRGERIWRGADKQSARLCLGDYNSLQEQLVAIIDFTTRNKLSLNSADYSLQTELRHDPEKLIELNRLLGEPFFRLMGHWFWFSLNEKEGKVYFPRYNPPDKEKALPATVSVYSFEDQSETLESDSLFEDKDEQIDENLYLKETFAARAYWKNRQKLSESMERIKELYSSIGNENVISSCQWTQLIAFTLEFNPDLIIEVGRTSGNSTLVFTEAAAHLGLNKAQVLSVWPTEEWKATFDKAGTIVKEEWFEPLVLYRDEVYDFPYEDHLRDARKVLVFLDTHSFDIAEWSLGKLLPLIADRKHVVLVHDISDARYYSPQLLRYGDNKLWRTKAQTGGNLIIGNVASQMEMAITLVDFSCRNGITLFSADHSLHSAFDNQPEKVQEMQSLLGNEFFDTQAHWRWFSVNEALSSPTFPVFKGLHAQ